MKHCDDAAVAWLRIGSGFLVLVSLLLLSGAASSYLIAVAGSRPRFQALTELGFAAVFMVLAVCGIGGTFAHHGGARWILLPYFVLHLLLLSGVVAMVATVSIFQTSPVATDFIHRACGGESPPEWCGTSAEEEELTAALADYWDLIAAASDFAVVFSFLNIIAAYWTATHPPTERRTIIDMQREHAALEEEQQSLKQPMLAQHYFVPYSHDAYHYSVRGGGSGMPCPQHQQYQHQPGWR